MLKNIVDNSKILFDLFSSVFQKVVHFLLGRGVHVGHAILRPGS